MAIYRRFRVQRKYVNGQPTEEYRLGAEIDSTDYNSLEECEKGSDCTQLEYRWVDMESADDYICDGVNKYKKQKKQQKCVNEEIWTNVYPYEYQKGELIEHDSVDCGYVSDKHYLYTSINGQGSIMVTPSKNEYSRQENVNILAFPSANYMFEKYEYGSTPAYGSTRLRPDLDLTMSNDWYVKANFIYGTASSGSLYYSYNTGSESWYNWSKSTLSKADNNGSIAKIIIDYGGVVQTIPSSAFSSQSYLTKIVFPNCAYVNYRAFQSCYKLTTVNLQNCISVGECAFEHCEILPSIDLQNCSYVGSFAFKNCYSLTTVNLQNCISLSRGAFSCCSALTSIDLSNCSYVDNQVFTSCYSLTSIDLPNCSFIGNAAFNKCQNLISVNLQLCEYIGNSAFWDCSLLPSIYLTNCSYVGSYAFEFCWALSSIDLPNCSYIGNNGLYNCSSLTSINLPNCSYVGDNVFKSCYSLSIVHLPKVTYIGSYAFSSAPIETLYMNQITSVPSGGDPYISSSYIKSIFIPCSLLDSFVSHSIWRKYSKYFVCV